MYMCVVLFLYLALLPYEAENEPRGIVGITTTDITARLVLLSVFPSIVVLVARVVMIAEEDRCRRDVRPVTVRHRWPDTIHRA